MLDSKSYLVIQSWMITELKLKGNELLIYAVIYGFSQDLESKFTGSSSYLCEWTNSTKQGVFKCLKSLVEKGFIQRFETIKNGVKLVDYRATKFTGVVNKVDRGSKQSLPGGSKQSLPHNIELDNIEDNIEISNKSELQKTFNEFLEMRKKIKKPATEKAIELLKNKIRKFSNGDERLAIKIIEQSIVNSWQDVFELRQESKKDANVVKFQKRAL